MADKDHEVTALLERWRSGSLLLEAGHVCQTFLLAATWLGLAPFCTGLFSDTEVERDLRIDGITESFIYGAGVGTRPPGVDWAPWPLETGSDTPFARPRRARARRGAARA